MKAVLQWVLRTMMKDQTGIVRTMPKKDLVDFNVAMTAERLMRNGIDPNSLKNANQVENAINQIEAPRNVQQGIKSTKSAKVFDLEGKEIDPKKGIMGGKQIPDDDLPPPGSRGGPDDIAAPVQSAEESLRDMTEAEIKKRLEKQNKEAAKRFKDKMKDDPEDMAQGGRAGFKVGGIDKARRAFLKTVGAVGAGIGALKTGLLSIGKGAAGKKAVEQVVTTPSVSGKPEWFDALVNKVILEGDDVTKKLATKEREIVHTKKLEEGKFADEVTVYRDLDDGTVRVEYSSVDNMSEAPVNLTFKPGMADETTKGKPADTFQADEIVPESRMVGPDDFEIEDAVDEFDNVVDLNSDVSKLKQFAGEKLTTKEILEGINKRKRSRAIVEDRGEAADFMTSRQGDYDPSPDDFASGGVARMLGE